MINCFIVDTHAKLYNYLMAFLFLLLYPKDHQWFIVQLRNKYLTVFLYLWALCVMSYSFLTKMMLIIFRIFDVYIEYTELISIHFCLGARWSLSLGHDFLPGLMHGSFFCSSVGLMSLRRIPCFQSLFYSIIAFSMHIFDSLK